MQPQTSQTNIPTAQNNPGDIKQNGQIATFSSPVQGQAALYNDLTSKMTGTSTTGINGQSSLYDFAKVYAPSSDSNNPAQYAASLANQLKVNPDTPIGTLMPRIDDFAKAVATNEGYMSSIGQTPQVPNGQNTNQTSQDPGFWKDLSSGNLGGAGKDAFNFAFPVVKDLADDAQGQNQKSFLQQLGDAGLSALWFVPGLGEGTDLLANIGKGALLGYGGDVSSKLSQGNTNLGQILTPGLGTLTGGVAGGILPKIMGSLGKTFTEEGAVSAAEDNVEKSIGATKSGRNFLSDSSGVGMNPSKLIVRSGSIPDIVDGRFVTDTAEQNIQKRIGQLGEARATALDKVIKPISVDELRQEALGQVGALKATGETGSMSTKINKIFDDFKSTYGDTISAKDLEKIKEAQAGASGIYKRTGQIGEQNASSIIGNVARGKIESLADEAGFPGMNEYNQYIKEHYNAMDALNKLNGQTVKGGRLGNMLRGHTIAGISGLAASSLGGGFLGTLAAAGGGEAGNAILSKILGETSISNPLRDAVMSKIAQENPDIVQRLLDFSGGKGDVAPLLSPKSSKIPGLVSSVLTKASARGGSAI